jgi:hypothetical protein
VGFGIRNLEQQLASLTWLHTSMHIQEHRSPQLAHVYGQDAWNPDDGIIIDSVRAKAGDAGLGESEAGTGLGHASQLPYQDHDKERGGTYAFGLIRAALPRCKQLPGLHTRLNLPFHNLHSHSPPHAFTISLSHFSESFTRQLLVTRHASLSSRLLPCHTYRACRSLSVYSL